MSTKKSTSTNRTELRIGIADSTQELHIETEESPDNLLASVTASLDSETALVVVDTKSRKTIVPHDKIAFVEIGESSERKVGFTSL